MLDLVEFGYVRGHPAGVAKHVLGTQEQPRAGMATADEHEPGGKVACRLQRGITLQVVRTGGHRLHARRDALKQRRFAAAVLAHQECYGRGELQRLEIADERQGPGEAVPIDGGVRAPAQS